MIETVSLLPFLLQSSHTNVGDQASSAKVYLCHPRLLILILSLILIKLWLLNVDSWSFSSFFSSSFSLSHPPTKYVKRNILSGVERV